MVTFYPIVKVNCGDFNYLLIITIMHIFSIFKDIKIIHFIVKLMDYNRNGGSASHFQNDLVVEILVTVTCGHFFS